MNDLSTSIAVKSQLTPQQLMVFESEMNGRRKSVALAYVLDIFLGTTGAHRFYLGSTGVAVLQLVLFIVGIVTAAVVVGFFFIGISGLIAFIDLFTIPGLARAADQKVENEILSRLALMTSFAPQAQASIPPAPPAITS